MKTTVDQAAQAARFPYHPGPRLKHTTLINKGNLQEQSHAGQDVQWYEDR